MESNRLMFLDIDGVLNCQLHYTHSEQHRKYRETINAPDYERPDEVTEDKEYYASQLCKERISWLNTLCEELDIKVVISSTWRSHGLEFMQKVLVDNGATFDIIDITPWLRHEGCMRGNEIYHWLQENTVKLFGIQPHDFHDYVIVDDDSDMLLWQANHFFQTDNYSGLTPNTVYKIRRYFTGKTFSDERLKNGM